MNTTPVEHTQEPQPQATPDHNEKLDRDVRDLGTLMAMDWGLRMTAEADRKRDRGPRR